MTTGDLIMPALPARLENLPTPCLLLDELRMERNIARLRGRLQKVGVGLRPHLKTAKCIEVARRLLATPSGPAAVSTLKEAEEFATAGVRDIMYAVGIAPNKLDRVVALLRSGVDLSIILDSVDQAQAVVAKCRETGLVIPALIEVDSDAHRGGVAAGSALLVEIGRILHEGGAQLRGVMTHAGASYSSRSIEEIVEAAERERAAIVSSAAQLRNSGLPVPVVSVGSTPTAHFARDLSGVTEVRAGVFVFFDLVMAGIGVCKLEDIAIGVLATVIGHQRARGQIIVDAGWMAMSRDRGTSGQRIDQGYGLVCDLTNHPFPDLIMTHANQEHGILETRAGSAHPCPDLPLGTLVRILPNHACATAAQHGRYVVVRGDQWVATWPRIPSGW